MQTSKLRKFASYARKALIEQVGTRMKSVLAEGSLARRENAKAVADLEAKIKGIGRERTVEMVAYTWFNRFCALRYMDVNRYTKIGIVSPAEGQFQPELLAEAKMGHVDEDLVPAGTREKVMRLLDETDPSDDPQGEAYRLLLVAVCNHYHGLMPFMFEMIADFTELLLPDDLLSGNSILAFTREALLPINCSPEHTEESVEVIGWLYQFYIADKKDDVFVALKKGKKITPENIPAATQLFTPHWIVRYLVENSLGRLWMLNHPESKLVERMDYYIRPQEPETDYLKIASPEELKVCDPACGSGHMLTYAFDLLYAIYEEQGYNPTEIPRLILAHNLYGIEIDARAGALAAFALTMKAREKDRRFFSRPPITESISTPVENPKSKIQNPNVCVLENISVDPQELDDYMDKVGRDLFSGGLQGVVNQWEEADNFGSLIRPLVTDVSEVLELLRERQMGEDLFLTGVHQKVLKALRQADYLSPKYHVVVANPPYMGGRGMNPAMRELFATKHKAYKADLFAVFTIRLIDICVEGGAIGIVTPFNWMFIKSFEKLREVFLDECTITSLVRPEFHAFFDSAFVSLCAFTFDTKYRPGALGAYIHLQEFYGADLQAPKALEAIKNPNCGWFYRARAEDFKKIPGSPIAYNMPAPLVDEYAKGNLISDFVDAKSGQNTGDNERFVRFWFEVDLTNIGFGIETLEETKNPTPKWFPYNKGGEFRKWYGNFENVINWANDGEEVKEYAVERNGGKHWSRYIQNLDYMLREGITWTFISSSFFGARYTPAGHLFDFAGCSAFPRNGSLNKYLGYFCSGVAQYILKFLNPTLNLQPGNVSTLPEPKIHSDALPELESDVEALVEIVKSSWDAYERSWDFKTPPLRKEGVSAASLPDAYEDLRTVWRDLDKKATRLEEQNKKRFVEAFSLESVLPIEVSAIEVTLDSNPRFRYDADKTESELEALLLADTMREFISYAVGCMLGRYSLDKPGLILANQGETADDYRQQIPEPTFAPDEDNVIPMLDGDWFTDDITDRFKEFLKVTFGTEHYEENLTFLENALYPENVTGKKRKTIRDYFLKGFYDHHIKIYKKRPIYWLFSSPKGTFNALIYMHRYRPDTVSTVLQYLRDFRDKLAHRRDHLQAVADSGSASQSDKTKALKEVATLKKQLKELEDYETETLFPLAQKKIDIDLDNGVKHNYPLFGNALKKVTGLS